MMHGLHFSASCCRFSSLAVVSILLNASATFILLPVTWMSVWNSAKSDGFGIIIICLENNSGCTDMDMLLKFCKYDSRMVSHCCLHCLMFSLPDNGFMWIRHVLDASFTSMVTLACNLFSGSLISPSEKLTRCAISYGTFLIHGTK